MTYSRTRIARSSAWLAAGAFAVVLSTVSSSAQDYGSGYYYYDQAGPRENVEVYAPRFHQHRGALGGDIVDASMSKEVYAGDLDLRSGWGAHVLRERIRSAARELCQRLDLKYPLTTQDSPPCYQTAVAGGMADADDAIARARGYAAR